MYIFWWLKCIISKNEKGTKSLCLPSIILWVKGASIIAGYPNIWCVQFTSIKIKEVYLFSTNKKKYKYIESCAHRNLLKHPKQILVSQKHQNGIIGTTYNISLLHNLKYNRHWQQLTLEVRSCALTLIFEDNATLIEKTLQYLLMKHLPKEFPSYLLTPVGSAA